MQPLSHGFEPGAPPYPAARTPARRPPIRLQVLLFLLTCITTFAAGVSGWQAELLGFDDRFGVELVEHWQRGLLYMVAVQIGRAHV